MKTFDIIDIKKQTEETEVKYLSQYACKSIDTKGRLRSERKCPLRTEFQRDRDKILHSKAFRRLKHKTQVFLSPVGDHYRTRLTHTLEVSQIARTMARALRLNEDLTEAIALGHDLGHTPFGHTGERVLNEIMPNGFKHNEQSIRVVTLIEDLNLTQETLNGIENHTGKVTPFTLEGQLVKISDRIAYINHDIDDAIRAGIIKETDLPKESRNYLGKTKSRRISSIVIDIIENSINRPEILISDECKKHMDILRSWLFENVYYAKKEEYKAERIVRELFYLYVNILEKTYNCEDENLKKRIVCDYIAGMTDRYAIQKYKKYFLPANNMAEEHDTLLFTLAEQNLLRKKK